MPSLPVILLGGLVVLLLVALIALFVGDRLAARKLNDGSEAFKGWDEISETDVARRIGTRAEAAAKRARTRRRDAAAAAAAAGATSAFEPVPETQAEADAADAADEQGGFHYYPTTAPSRFRVWRDAAAVLLVIALAVLAVAVYLPTLTSGPAASVAPSEIANASHSPGSTHTPRPSGSEEPSSFPTAVAGVPDAPTGVTAAASADGVSLSWTAPLGDGGALVAGFQIYRAASSGAEALLTTVGLESSYTDSAVSPGATYFYYVRAVNSVGPGAPSDEVSGTIPTTGPGRPGTLFASASGTSITLGWSKPSVTGGSAITGYILYRGTSSGGEGLIARLGNITGFTDTGRSPGTTYYYVVRAVNGAGAGFSSNEAHATIAAVGPGVPLSLSASSSAGSVALTWNAPSFNGGSSVNHYNVLRSTTTGSGYGVIGTATSAHYTDSSVAAGTVYYYVVQTVTGVGTSGNSNQASGQTVPAAPVSLSATGGVSSITLSWSAPSNGGSSITGYVVLKSSSSGGTYSVVASPTSPGFTDTGLSSGAIWYYKVQAVNGIGTGPAAGPATNGAASVPGAPTGVSGSPGNGSVTVSWTAPSDTGGSAITGYTVTSSGSQTCSSSSSPCTVTGLSNGVPYTFTVTATNGAGTGSPSSASSSVTPRTVPGQPGTPTAVAGNGSAQVSWTAAAENGSTITGYTVTGSPGGSCTTSGALTCNVTGLTNGVSYTFTVTATNGAGTGSASSASNSVTPSAPATVPDAPTGLNASAGGSGGIQLNWNVPSSNGGGSLTYDIYRSSPGPGGETPLVSGVGTNSYLDASVTTLQDYSYYVIAHNSVGDSGASNEVTFTAP